LSDSPTPRLLGVALLTVSVTVVLLQIYIQDHTTPANFLPYQIFEAIATGVAQTYVFWSFFTAVFPAAFFPFRKSVALILPLKVLSRVSMSFGWPLTLSVILAFSYCVASLVLSFFMPAYRSREIWLANPSHSQWRLRITIAQTALGALLATSVAVLDPLTSSVIFLFCLPVYGTVALYTIYYDSKSQREKGTMITNDISYVLISGYFASAFTFSAGPMVLGVSRIIPNLLLALAWKVFLLIMNFFAILFARRAGLKNPAVFTWYVMFAQDLFFDLVFIDTSLSDISFWLICVVDVVIVSLRDTQSVGILFGRWGEAFIAFFDGDMASLIRATDHHEDASELEAAGGTQRRDQDSDGAEEAACRADTMSTLGFASEITATSSIILALSVESLTCYLSTDARTCRRALTLGLNNEERRGAVGLYFILMLIQTVTHVASREFVRRKRRLPEPNRDKMKKMWSDMGMHLHALVVLCLAFLLSAASRHRHTVNEGGIFN